MIQRNEVEGGDVAGGERGQCNVRSWSVDVGGGEIRSCYVTTWSVRLPAMNCRFTVHLSQRYTLFHHASRLLLRR